MAEYVHRPIDELLVLLAAPVSQGLPRSVRTELSSALGALQKEVKESKRSTRRLTEERAATNETVTKLQQELTRLRQEKQDWLDQRSELRITIGHLKEEIVDLNSQLSRCRQELTQLKQTP